MRNRGGPSGTQVTVLVIFLLSAPQVAAENAPERFDVRAFGALGNGIADDQPALIRAAQAITRNKGGVLYFPGGTYRCGRGGANGVEFAGVSNVTIFFEPGAVLLMDNLNPQTGIGDRGHGILFRGPCHDITLENVSVKWRTKPASRSLGDAFRFEGFPSDDRCISKIRMLACSAELSPQTGAVLMGCSDIDVKNFSIVRTWADGLHFNACRRVHVDGVTGIETGDDTLSFVTYQDDKAVNSYSGGPGSYARADFGEWNSNDSRAINIRARGGGANGVRLAGAKNVELSNVDVKGKLRGVISDCGKKEGNKHSWSWLASHGINISDVTAIDCTSGFYVSNFNQPTTGDDKWWRFDIRLSNFRAKNCADDSLVVKDAAGVKIKEVVAADRGIRILNARDCNLNGIELKGGELIVEGPSKSSQPAPNLNLELRNLRIDSGYLDIRDCRGIIVAGVQITRPVGVGFQARDVFDSHFNAISIGKSVAPDVSPTVPSQ